MKMTITKYLLFVFIIGISSAVCRPAIAISTIVISPRVGMLDSEETTFWASTVSYQQQFSSRFGLEAQFELGSETDLLPNPFRVYNFSANLELSKINLRIGRLTYWSNLVIGQVDGVDIKYSLGKAGSLNLFGGFNAVTDFSDTEFTGKQMFLFSWGRGKIGKNQAVSFWLENDGDKTCTFTGFSIAQPLMAGIKLRTNLALSIDEGQLYHSRIYLSKSVGKHIVSTGYRQRRFLARDPYPWVDEEVLTAPQINFGVNSRISKELQWWNQINYRLGEDGSAYLRSTASWKIYALSVVTGSYGNNSLTGASLGIRKNITTTLSAGGSFSFNAVDYNDLIEPQNSMGAYGWLGWQPGGKLAFRLFGRYHKNPYYEYDVRGGLVLNVAL